MPQEKMVSTQRILNAEVAILLDLLEQLQTMTIGLNLEPEAVDISVMAAARPGSALETYLKKEPAAAPDMMRCLPPGALARFQASYTDFQAIANLYKKYLPQILGTGSEQAAAEIDQMMAEIAQWKPLSVAYSLGRSPEGGMNFAYLIQSPDAEKVMALAQSKINLANEGWLHDFYKDLGLDMSVKPVEGAMELRGQPVARYDFKVAATSGTLTEETAFIDKAFPGGEMGMVRLDELILATWGMPLTDLEQALAAPAPGVPGDAISSFPAGATAYGDFDIIQYLKFMFSLMPGQAPQANLDNVKASPLAMAGYHQAGKALYQVRVPKDLVLGLKTAFTTPPPQSQPAPFAAAPFAVDPVTSGTAE
jgi:hypothetical protein